ncbi:response regulator transcription factor [Nocardia sp. NPDC058666]|uniref:response regulator transcription factor n=1 Tax=Nocardia sp. NPDC058666 TaxID=3346587 RepID=UPI00364F83A4
MLPLSRPIWTRRWNLPGWRGGSLVVAPRGGHRCARDAADPAARARVDALTEREREVLALVGRGLSNAEIGRALFLAEATVKFHVSAILRRLGLDNRVQAAICAYEAGLTRGDSPAR